VTRVQILLTEEQDRRLEQLARRLRTPKALLVREGVDLLARAGGKHSRDSRPGFFDTGAAEAMMPVIVSEKGWVVIPAELRRKYNLQPGTEVSVVDYGGVLSLVPAMARPTKQAAGILKGRRPLTRALLVEHRRERARGR